MVCHLIEAVYLNQKFEISLSANRCRNILLCWGYTYSPASDRPLNSAGAGIGELRARERMRGRIFLTEKRNTPLPVSRIKKGVQARVSKTVPKSDATCLPGLLLGHGWLGSCHRLGQRWTVLPRKGQPSCNSRLAHVTFSNGCARKPVLQRRILSACCARCEC